LTLLCFVERTFEFEINPLRQYRIYCTAVHKDWTQRNSRHWSQIIGRSGIQRADDF